MMSQVGFFIGMLLGVAWPCIVINVLTTNSSNAARAFQRPRFWIFGVMFLTAWIWMSWLFYGLSLIPWSRVLPDGTFNQRIITKYEVEASS